jgi:uncharacterized repeat protein (TIGR03803 family)
MNTSLLKTALLGSALALALSAGAAQAGGFKVLHSFAGGSSDGAGPFGGVTPAGLGGFYIATDGGGSSNKGTLTLLRKDGTTQVLHTFTGGSDGQNADGAPLVWKSFDNNVYGTTQFGGSAGCGTIYRYTPGSGAYQQVHAFQCGGDGAFPFAGLTSAGAFGDLFGTGYAGGSNDDGSLVFVAHDGSAGETCFFSGSDGKAPFAGVTPISNDLYTVTTAGGASNLGVIAEFPGNCGTKVLHNFAGGNDGATPYGALLYHNGVLYGTASKGGSPGLGVVFKIDPDGSNYAVLHAFQGICCGNSDGSFPHSGLTFNKSNGMLYGTTINGGNSSDNGTVFSIDPKTSTEKVAHAFSGSDGAHPYGTLYIKKGAIYGTASGGGASNLGVVFKLKS